MVRGTGKQSGAYATSRPDRASLGTLMGLPALVFLFSGWSKLATLPLQSGLGVRPYPVVNRLSARVHHHVPRPTTGIHMISAPARCPAGLV